MDSAYYKSRQACAFSCCRGTVEMDVEEKGDVDRWIVLSSMPKLVDVRVVRWRGARGWNALVAWVAMYRRAGWPGWAGCVPDLEYIEYWSAPN